MEQHKPTTVIHIDHEIGSAVLLRREIEKWAEVKHAGIAASAVHGIAACRALRPDIAILELGIPDREGFAVAREIANLDFRPKVIALTSRADEAMFYRLDREPELVTAFVWKVHTVVEDLRSALHAVRLGRRFYPRPLSEAIRRFNAKPDAFTKFLSRRQIEFLTLFGQGMSDREVAAATGMTAAGAHTARVRLMARLGLHRADELLLLASRTGFVRPCLPLPPGLVEEIH